MPRPGLTVVIGGGAAGIAAAHHLHDAGQDVLLVEAKDRLGGRAYSVALSLPVTPAKAGVFGRGYGNADEQASASAAAMDGRRLRSVAVDFGCGWFHSAQRNPWVGIAEAAGLTVDRSDPGWGEQWRDLGFPPADRQAFGEAWDRMEAAARAALGGPDRALGDFIAPDDRWRPLLDAMSGYINGAPLAAVSVHDWAAYEDAAGEENWALPDGYGTLVVGHAAGLAVQLGTPVTRIDHRGHALRIETPAGAIEAARAIITVPTSALQDIVFDPPLPAKQDAAAALPLGLADKVFLAVDGPEWPAQAHLVGNPHSAYTASYRLSPFGWPVIEAFFGGEGAEALECAEDAYAQCLDELVALLGGDWRARLHPLAATRWRHEPYILGSYSHARIGRAPARAVLAEPVDERLFFAGEACSARDFSTAHGAYETGVTAARAVVALGASG